MAIAQKEILQLGDGVLDLDGAGRVLLVGHLDGDLVASILPVDFRLRPDAAP